MFDTNLRSMSRNELITRKLDLITCKLDLIAGMSLGITGKLDLLTRKLDLIAGMSLGTNQEYYLDRGNDKQKKGRNR